jgi:DNA-binding CsgD family transcriptional regulator
LGEAAFTAAWVAGRALSLEEAVTEARGVGAEREVAGALPATDPAAAAGLTPREAEILRLLVAGRTNPEIAEALFLSPRTVSTHLTHVFAKLEVTNRAEAIAFALRRGLA